MKLINSKTFWLAVVQALSGVLVVFATTYPQVGMLLVVKSVIDVVLRLLTYREIDSFN